MESVARSSTELGTRASSGGQNVKLGSRKFGGVTSACVCECLVFGLLFLVLFALLYVL